MLMASILPITEALAQNNPSGKKVLVAYYSLRNGNTRIVAEEIKKNVGGDLFRIETVQSYPAEYRAVTEQAKKELNSRQFPKIKSNVNKPKQYDVIYIGSPNWWGTIAPAVFTFLEANDFSGKIIIPFITHEGSHLGNSVDDIKKLEPKAKVLEGIAIRGGSVNNSADDVKKWLKKIGQIK